MEDGRIKIIRKHYGLGQTEFSKRIGIKQAYLSELENGKKKITSNIISQITIKFPEIAINWLFNGVGDMFQKTSDATESGAPIITSPIPLYERLLNEKDARIQMLEEHVAALKTEVKELKSKI